MLNKIQTSFCTLNVVAYPSHMNLLIFIFVVSSFCWVNVRGWSHNRYSNEKLRDAASDYALAEILPQSEVNFDKLVADISRYGDTAQQLLSTSDYLYDLVFATAGMHAKIPVKAIVGLINIEIENLQENTEKFNTAIDLLNIRLGRANNILATQGVDIPDAIVLEQLVETILDVNADIWNALTAYKQLKSLEGVKDNLSDLVLPEIKYYFLKCPSYLNDKGS